MTGDPLKGHVSALWPDGQVSGDQWKRIVGVFWEYFRYNDAEKMCCTDVEIISD